MLISSLVGPKYECKKLVSLSSVIRKNNKLILLKCCLSRRQSKEHRQNGDSREIVDGIHAAGPARRGVHRRRGGGVDRCSPWEGCLWCLWRFFHRTWRSRLGRSITLLVSVPLFSVLESSLCFWIWWISLSVWFNWLLVSWWIRVYSCFDSLYLAALI